ncbi:MarR family winged helix-turn-helix transcriptional regulator [Micromonospora echinaurantiaca]|uniref:MarR family winged helix-turn-helix transcriptional regulator n=1 Tax=Micromonospora echinaurantiaca TaxID=47857 RepID=UPI00371CAED6
MSKSDVPREVARQIRLLQQSFDAFDEAAAVRLGINRTDLRALDVVLDRGPLTAGELTAALRLSPAATTTVIDRLERAGLVARTRDPENRRRVLVAATESAHAAEREIYRPLGEAGLRALARYDGDQLATIVDFLVTARAVQQEHAERLAGGSRQRS